MSLELMKQRLDRLGGPISQNRMINGKLNSMLAAIRNSYQSAKFSLWGPNKSEIFLGLFNPSRHTENFDNKVISTEFKNNIQVGSYFKWENTGTYWICFLQDKTELAYFKGQCRECNFKVSWVDGKRRLMETLVAVIGPSVNQLSTSSSMQSKVSEDFPNGLITMFVQNNPINRAFFTRYQIFLLNRTAYQIQTVDMISMPGILQMSCQEHYANKIEDNVEENITNYWNVQPIIPEETTDYAIEGPAATKPLIDTVFETHLKGGYWLIVENEGVTNPDLLNPARIVEMDNALPQITVYWNSTKSGAYTIGYRTAAGALYQKYIVVQPLM